MRSSFKLGRVVKGAALGNQAYQLKAPPVPGRAGVIVSFDDDPRFTQLHATQPDSEAIFEEAVPVDLDGARAEAEKILYDAAADAERLLTDARDRSLALIDDALSRTSEIEDASKKAGFQQGEGDGRAAAQAEMDEMLETMRGLVEMARIERYKIIEDAEPEIVRLAITLAERVLGAHVALEPNTVLEMARSAITRLVSRETVTVRVNPADIANIREHRENLMSMNDIDNLRVIEDQRVDRGGVVFEADAGTIDAKISTQLREARRLLSPGEPLAVTPSGEPALFNQPAQAS